jgi:hypothetical protein
MRTASIPVECFQIKKGQLAHVLGLKAASLQFTCHQTLQVPMLEKKIQLARRVLRQGPHCWCEF